MEIEEELDQKIYEIISKDLENLGLSWPSDKLVLSEKERVKVWARGGYTVGQLVHLVRQNKLMALAPDDIIGVPSTGSASRQDCNISVKLAKDRITLPMPIFSSNMECVTDANLAITMALMGGIGVLHQFQEIADQAREVETVKKAPIKKIEISGREYVPALDCNGRLLVAAASSVKNDFMKRVDALVKAGVDILVLDVAHGDSVQMYDAIKKVREKYPAVVLMAGNIITPKAAYLFCKNGVDIIKANVGPGFACTTRKITGFGVPSITGLYDVVMVAREFGVDVIGDGGVNDSGTGVKYLATGVKGLMIGTTLAATSSSAKFGQRHNQQKNTVLVWGSASERSKESQGRPKWDAPEGIAREMNCLGETKLYLANFITGLQSGLSYAGADAHGQNNIGRLTKYSRWALQTAAGAFEGKKGN